jgi:hypothetical protein
VRQRLDASDGNGRRRSEHAPTQLVVNEHQLDLCSALLSQALPPARTRFARQRRRSRTNLRPQKQRGAEERGGGGPSPAWG